MSAVIKLSVNHDLLLTANQRLHWSHRAASTSVLRAKAKIAARQVAFHYEHALIDVLITPPDRRRRDTHNLYPTVKAHIDGFVDARLIPDDSWKHLDGPHLHMAEGTTRPTPAERTQGIRPWLFSYTITRRP